MKITRTVLLLTLLLITGAGARCGRESSGDTASQLRIFHKGDLIIATIFLDGRASAVTSLNSFPASDQGKSPSEWEDPSWD